MGTNSINAQYQIPRVNVQMPGRQNRLLDGNFRITPGLTEVVDFFFGNQDGVPLNLVPFKVKFVVWVNQNLDRNDLTMGTAEIILSKQVDVIDPYAGSVEMLLTDQDTLTLGRKGSGLRWGLFMINEDGQVFPTQVHRNGGRYGRIQLDLDSGIPMAEIIKHT